MPVPSNTCSATLVRRCSRAAWLAASISTLSIGAAAGAQAASDDPRSDGIEQITVTAQKIKERLQDVPISISVLGGGELDKLTTEGVFEALNRVPGVTTTAPSNIGGGAQLAVRGVSAGGPQFNGSSPIAYYLDSVPFGLVKTAIVPDSNIYDLERIEVLRGPQGTLYGASAQNGVIRVLTNDANASEFEMKARTSLSTTDDGGENYRGDVAINMPLVEDRLAARIVLGYESMGGWIDKPNKEDANDAELQNARLKVNGQLTDELSLGLVGWVSRSDYGAPSSSDDDQRRSSPADESIDTEYDVYGLNLGYDAPGFTVTSMTSYIDYHTDSAIDLLPFFGTSILGTTNMDSEVFSEEITVTSSQEGAWRWSFGGMYRDGEDRLLQEAIFFPVPVDFTDKSRSFALFGQVTRVLLDGRFEITGGLRYFEDDVTQIENQPQTNNPADPLLPPDKRTFDATSPRVVLSWHPVQDSTIYASYSEGFRSGFNQNANVIRSAPEFPPVKADTLRNYEVGAKGVLGGGLFSFDAAVFYMDWEDVQQTLSVLFNGIQVSAVVNGESASGLGAEFALVARPAEGLDLGLNFSWNDLAADSGIVTAGLALYDAGDRLSYSSEYTAGASLDYEFPVGSYTARLATSANYVSELRNVSSLGPGLVIIDEGEEQLIARASFAVESPRGWVATAFVENLNNEDARGPGVLGVPDWTQRIRPRTVGLQLEFRF